MTETRNTAGNTGLAKVAGSVLRMTVFRKFEVWYFVRSLVLRNPPERKPKPLPASVGRPTRPPTDDQNSGDNFAIT